MISSWTKEYDEIAECTRYYRTYQFNNIEYTAEITELPYNKFGWNIYKDFYRIECGIDDSFEYAANSCDVQFMVDCNIS